MVMQMRANIACRSLHLTVKNFVKIFLFSIFLFIGIPSSYASAEAFPFWSFDPITYIFKQGETLHLTAVLCNHSSATNDFYASTVANGAGVAYLPGKNLYQQGLDIDFSDLISQFNSVVLSPGECHSFEWGTVSSWKIVSDGQYTIDYASINGLGWSGAIVAENVFTIYVNRNPPQLSLGALNLLLKK